MTNGWISELWDDKTEFAILVGATYPIWAAILYVQSFKLLEKRGNVYTINY